MTRLPAVLRRSKSLLLVPALAVAVLAGSASGASAATHGGHTSVDTRDGIYSHGAFSIQLTVHNATDQTMTLDTTRTVHTGYAHWATRAQPQLASGASETITAYTDNPVGLTVEVVYTLDDGEFGCTEVDDEVVGSNDIQDGIGSDWDDLSAWYTDADPLYQENNGTVSGGNHIWADATLGVPRSN